MGKTKVPKTKHFSFFGVKNSPLMGKTKTSRFLIPSKISRPSKNEASFFDPKK
jgi:hypothetical protein